MFFPSFAYTLFECAKEDMRIGGIFVLFNQKVYSHKDMADVNVYAASRLRDMAFSLGRLAQSFSEQTDGQHLTREDGESAMMSAASLVCGNCNRCSLYGESAGEDNYFLYYLIRAFEVNGVIGIEDMPALFQQTCFHKNEYLKQLNRSLGRATMNLSWKNKFMESRDAVIVQFRELASIIEEFSVQMEQAMDVTVLKEKAIRKAYRKHAVQVENMLLLEYENRQREAYITMKSTHGTCLTAKEAANILGQAMGRKKWYPAREGKAIVTRQSGTFRFLEEGKYRMLHGVARVPKQGQQVSGDNYTFFKNLGGQEMISLADGMGSGEVACQESRQVIELIEQLLEAGFSVRSAVKLVNTVLLLAGPEQHPAAVDCILVDLNSGMLESMKLGAAGSFIMGQNGVEILESGDLPVGVLNPIEPVLISKKLWNDDRIIMVSDGVLDALPGERKEEVMKEFLQSAGLARPQVLADQILAFALSFGAEVRDDMTVLVSGIWDGYRK